MMSSPGRASRTACMTDRPPSPESNIPMGALLTDRLLRDVASVLEVAGQPGTDEDTQHQHDGSDDRALRKRLSDRVTDDAGKYRLKGIDENGTCRRDEVLCPAHHNLVKDNHADQDGHTDISHGRRIKANVFKDNAVERAPKRDGNQLSKAKSFRITRVGEAP